MARGTKRKITVSLLSFAAVTVVVALSIAAVRSSSPPPDSPDPLIVDPPDPAPVVKPPEPTPPPVAKPEPPPEPQPQPKVDVVFVLDTTGSMGGLIQGAKRKIWSIANQIISGQPQPHVRIGLIGYRDLGDDYVTKRFELTENVDDVYGHLRRFSANGGGDTPEHVNRALAEALRKMQWRKGQSVLRQIYLVGDAPPHEGRDGLFSAKLAREAAREGIVINAVRCGRMTTTARVWRKIALAAGGKFASIRQDGAMVAMATPMDKRLAALNAELSTTLLPTGSAGGKAAARRRRARNSDMDALAQAESAKYRASTGSLDSNDLLTVLKRKGKKVGELKDEELPAPLAGLGGAEREAYVKKVAKKRSALQAKIKSLASKRDAWLEKNRPKGPKSFDDTISEALKEQGARAGVAY